MSNIDENVEVNPLDAEQMDAAVQRALEAIGSASTLEELAQAKREHFGDGSAVVLASRAIGGLPG